ncbi:thiamine transporter [Lachnospiraceae bacterium PF1-21]
MNNTTNTQVTSFSVTKKLVFSAMAIALALITSYLKVIDMPMGGSVTLMSMLFITLIGYWFGPGYGLLCGVAYGCLQFFIDPYMLSIPQVICDYPLAFGALGLSGFFRNKKYGLQIGYIAGVLGRYFFAILSGILFFAVYAEGSGMSPLVYSLSYNGAYLGAEAIITLIIISLPPVTKGLQNVKKQAIQE